MSAEDAVTPLAASMPCFTISATCATSMGATKHAKTPAERERLKSAPLAYCRQDIRNKPLGHTTPIRFSWNGTTSPAGQKSERRRHCQ
jgi:hypothetical protein